MTPSLAFREAVTAPAATLHQAAGTGAGHHRDESALHHPISGAEANPTAAPPLLPLVRLQVLPTPRRALRDERLSCRDPEEPERTYQDPAGSVLSFTRFE